MNNLFGTILTDKLSVFLLTECGTVDKLLANSLKFDRENDWIVTQSLEVLTKKGLE